LTALVVLVDDSEELEPQAASTEGKVSVAATRRTAARFMVGRLVGAPMRPR